VLMSRMEMDAKARGDILRRMGLKQAVSPEGLPMPTRDQGKSLFPARDIEEAAKELIAKYTPERPSASLQVPEPIRLLQKFVRTQEIARQKLEADTLAQLTEQTLNDQLQSLGKLIDPKTLSTISDDLIKAVQGQAKAGKKQAGFGELLPPPDAKGNITIRNLGGPGRNITINPTQLRADAARIAEANTAIDLNLPEALDYLQSAMRFRNQSVINYNGSMKRGSSRIQDAQRYIDTGNAVYKDIEGLVLNNVPRIKQEYDGMKMVLEDYAAAYEKNLPLLLTQKTRGGDEFLLPNERLLQTAFQLPTI
jgi:hypothetical protein